MGDRNSVKFKINGELYVVDSRSEDLSPESKLVDFIRDKAKLKGTKYLCREGGCGACVVTVSSPNPSTNQSSIKSINSCLTPVLSCDGWEIWTVEELGNRKDGYHPIQKRLAEFGGTQCGFCTPGMVMAMHSLMEGKNNLTVKDIEDSLDGNICRCTGYRPILDAFRSFGVDASPELGEKCSDNSGCLQCPCAVRQESSKCSSNASGDLSLNNLNMEFEKSSGRKWLRANSLESLYEMMGKMSHVNLQYKLVAGNTGIGIFKNDERELEGFIDISSIAELQKGTYSSSGIIMGAGITITDAIHLLTKASEFHEDLKYAGVIAQHFSHRLGNIHIRNTSTLGGNLILKHNHLSFASDVFLLFEAVGAQISIGCSSSRLSRTFSLPDFLSKDLKGKVILSLHLPPVSPDFVLRSFKITPRYQNSKGYVNAAFLFRVAKAQNFKVVQKPTIVFGGISPNFIHAAETESFLNGKSLGDSKSIGCAFEILNKELNPDEQPLNGSSEYRKSLAKSLLYKVILGILGETVDAKLVSGGKDLTRGSSTGQQKYLKDNEKLILYKGFPKLESMIQCSGEAEYTNDIQICDGELFGAFVLSTVANARLKSIDPSPALRIPGTVGFVDAKDIPGPNNYMVSTPHPEEIFVSRNIHHAGQPLGLILAETREIAFAAAQKVLIEYEDVEKPILSIRDSLDKARREGSLDECTVRTVKSSIDTGSEVEHMLKGEFQVGGQHHFQMEPHTCLTVPRDGSGLDVFSATQWIDNTQEVVSSALKIPVNNINVQVRRLGGGFGGKASRSGHIAAACAVASHKTNRPVRVTLDLETHMRMSGKKLPWEISYEVGFDDRGKIVKLDVKAYCDPGFSPNEETTFLYMMNIQNVYETDGWSILTGRALTNTPANTFCRAPGHVQGAATIEYIMDHIAFYLKKDSWEVREINLMQRGSPIIYHPGLKHQEDNPLREMVSKFKKDNNYDNRVRFVKDFNEKNRWTKRGLAFIPVKHDNHFIGGKYRALVGIYHIDGTVVVSHGGIEMGQGINTKVAQVVAEVLGISISKVSVKATNNVISPNSSLTATGTTSESCCCAAAEACKILVDRMSKVREEMSDAPWDKIVAECHNRSIDLTASFMNEAKKDGVQGYPVWSLNMTEVEVDILTGEFKIVRLDYLTDGTKSLNPEVDIGQVEGGLVFGLGLWTTEKLIYDQITGQLLTHGTWDYKPPQSKDIPEDLRVTMYTDSRIKGGVLGSKGPGEPSVCSSFCVLLALRQAINAARRKAGNLDWYRLDGPVSPEDIVKLCLTSSTHFSL